jgi:tryptophan-rich sensory protein
MGIAMSYIVKCPSSITRSVALTTWTIHMVLNIAWAPIFFGRQQLRLGQAINIALLITLGGIILPTFFQLNPRSAYLLLPYTLWLSFATCLNASICRRNPTQGGYNAAKFHAQLAKLQQNAQTYSGL